ncbi:hypothetical protein A7982_13505 [Minicystis rosea]|nr:hypothetical protein A7982_13505 [Minicystis rosea]
MDMSSPTLRERRLPVWLIAAFMIAGLLAFHLLRGKGIRAPSGKVTARTEKATYQNRALLPRPAARAASEPAPLPAIRGTIYDTSGQQIAGATIVAATFDAAGNIPSISGSAKSDDLGRFEIVLPEGTYQLNAEKDGYGPSATAAQSGETVSMVLGRSGAIHGHARDPQGRPVPRFTVDIASMAPGDAPAPPPLWSRAFESADGSFRVPHVPTWPVIVRVMAEGYAPALSPPISVPPNTERELNLTLDEGCVVQGTARDAGGVPLPGVLVNAEERLTAGSLSDPVVQVASQAQSDSHGRFRIEHVPRGTVIVRGYDGENAVTTVTMEIADCASVPPVDLVMSPGGAVAGVARRADGVPLAGVRVTVMDRSIGFVNTRSDGEGRFRFDNLPAGTLRMELEHEGRSAIQFATIEEGRTVTQDMVLFASGDGEIRGRVMGGATPIANARVFAASSHRGNIALYFAVTGADGTFRIPKLPAGPYLLNLMSTLEGRAVHVEAAGIASVEIDLSIAPAIRDPGRRAARQRGDAP